MQKVNEVTIVPKVPSTPTGPRMEDLCIICNDPTHLTTDCTNVPQVKGAIQIKQANALNYPRKPFTLHIWKLIIQGGVNTLTLAGRVMEDMLPQVKATHLKILFKATQVFQTKTFQVKIFKTKGFQIKLLISKIKGHKDFLRILAKAFTFFPKEIKIINLTNLHIKEIWRTL